MIVPSCPKRFMIARNQLTVVMWALCPWSHRTSKECNVVTKRIPIVLGHFVNQTVFHITRGIEMINHIYSCQIIAANGVVLRVWISVPPCFPSHRDSSGRLFHDLSRKHAGNPRVQNYAQNQLGCGTNKKQAALSCQNDGSNIMY